METPWIKRLDVSLPDGVVLVFSTKRITYHSFTWASWHESLVIGQKVNTTCNLKNATKSDRNLISPQNIIPKSHIKVTSIKEMIIL